MRRTWASICIGLIASAVPTGEASAIDWSAGFGDWSGAFGLRYDTGSQSLTSGDGASTTASNRHFSETLALNRRYYLFDPRLVVGALGLQLNLNQDSNRDSGSGSSTSGRVIGYSFDSTFLAEKPYNANLYANRNQRQSTPAFGGRTEGVAESRGLRLHLGENSELKDWGVPWFSANLQLRSESDTEKTTIFGQSFTRNEGRKVLDMDLKKGFETADLGLRYVVNDLENRDFSQGNYRSRTAQLNYSLDFGPTLNRRSDLRINWTNRNGGAPLTRLTVDEQLRIEHLQNLSTSYQYGFSRQQSEGAMATTGQSGSFSVTHQLYRNLTTSAAVSGSRTSLPNGSTSAYGGSLSQGYQHRLPGDGRVFANWSGSYRVNTNQLGASKIDVANEPHSAPSPLGAGAAFLLDHSFALAASIVVVDTRGGLRATAVLGVDYDVVAQGNQTRIVPTIGSLVILAGDPLELSYSYEVDANLQYTSTAAGIGGGVDYGWIALSMRHAQSNQKPLPGQESRFLESTRDDTAQLDLRGNWRGMAGQASGSFESYKATNSVYDRTLLTSVLSGRLRQDMNVLVALTAANTRFANPARRSSTRSARGSLDWQTPGGWSNSAFAELSTHDESILPRETVLRAGARSGARFALLSLGAGLSFSEFLRGGTRSRDARLDVSAVRSF